MAKDSDRKLIKRHDLDVGTFYFYRNYMVAEVKENIVFALENAMGMLQLAKAYFGNKTPFVYITNRVNSYSFNPTVHYKTVAMFPNLKGYATVTYDAINHEIAHMEEFFMNRPVKNFRNLEDAIAWAEDLIIKD